MRSQHTPLSHFWGFTSQVTQCFRTTLHRNASSSAINLHAPSLQTRLVIVHFLHLRRTSPPSHVTSKVSTASIILSISASTLVTPEHKKNQFHRSTRLRFTRPPTSKFARQLVSSKTNIRVLTSSAARLLSLVVVRPSVLRHLRHTRRHTLSHAHRHE